MNSRYVFLPRFCAILVIYFVMTQVESEDEICENIKFEKHNVSLICCNNNERNKIEVYKFGFISLNINGTILKCESIGNNTNLFSEFRSKTENETSSSVVEVKNNSVPALDLRQFIDTPGRCPKGTIMDAEGECVEVWN
ncbi:hypothetical protein WA026_009332 [Henosepilachna vigintioctopunctata]|uniref:Uncharacterized protein n=1 Tax=Henosepilachna vigintioctopunctata TaxID=420089 RepID=A0AAW1UYR6_9CUCU